MDLTMNRVGDEMIVESAKFIYKPANQLERDRLSVWVTAQDGGNHSGPIAGFLRVVVALSQMTRRPFGFANAGRLALPAADPAGGLRPGRPDHAGLFSRECRDMLQEMTSAWRLSMASQGG
jgi:hypothetical protein